MDWRDDAIVLSTRKLGENSVRLTVLTRDYGRYVGMVRSASGKTLRGTLECGNLIRTSWSARLSEHLGQFKCELLRSHVVDLLLLPGPLLSLSSACALLEVSLPERVPQKMLYTGTLGLIEALKSEFWKPAYLRWEIGLLEELGYGLDLSCCAVTGKSQDLHFVSPKSGRAVSLAEGTPYADRLLPLPAFLSGAAASAAARETPMENQYNQAVKLAGFFIHRDLFVSKGIRPVAARDRLASMIWQDAKGGDYGVMGER